MAIRLVERFAIGALVDVLSPQFGGEAWCPGRVVAHAHPGIWVESLGARWFVTNGGRIRERGGAAVAAETLLKVLTPEQWAEFEKAGEFAGSADDLRDGFIHLSTSKQLAGTVAKHFGGRTDLVVLEVDAGRLPAGALRWEVSKGGTRYPHLYAPLPLSAVARGAGGGPCRD